MTVVLFRSGAAYHVNVNTKWSYCKNIVAGCRVVCSHKTTSDFVEINNDISQHDDAHSMQ